MVKSARGKSRVVLAPEPQLMAGQLAPNRVLSVRLKPGEDVEWLWTLLPLGGRYVSGYRIVKQGKVLGFSVMRVSALHDVPMEVAL